MSGIDHIYLFIVAGVLLNLTPGPDVLYIVTNGMRAGVKAGVVAAFGITAGCFVHIAAAAVGVSALMAASATAFSLLKWTGAAYLMYVGVRMLLSHKPGMVLDGLGVGVTQAGAPAALKSVFFQGFWTNALNPKVALFFLAFVPQFIAPDVANKPLAFLLLGLLFNFNALWVNVGWAVGAAWLARRFAMLQQGMHWLERAAGLMFVGFGLKLALTDAPR